MRRPKPTRREVMERPDAFEVIDHDGSLRLHGPHIHPHPVWFRKGSNEPIAADMTQPVGAGVGATPTVVTPPMPSDIGATIDVSKNVLWSPWTGTAPQSDTDQGKWGTCYYISPIDSIDEENPGYIRSDDVITKYADGTFGVTFRRNLAAPVTVKVNGVVCADGCRVNPTTGACALPIFEKAYAYFRTGANTYASTENGWPGSVMTDLGMKNIAVYPTASTAVTALMAAVAGNGAVAACTFPTTKSGLLIGAHCYRVINAWTENGVTYVLLRNPWGFDGANPSGDPSDGLVTVTWAQFVADVSAVAVSTSYASDVRLATPTIQPKLYNFTDYVLLSNNFGQTTHTGPAFGDFNSDGKTDLADYTILSNAWDTSVGAVPPPPKETTVPTLTFTSNIGNPPKNGDVVNVTLTTNAPSVEVTSTKFGKLPNVNPSDLFTFKVVGADSYTFTAVAADGSKSQPVTLIVAPEIPAPVKPDTTPAKIKTATIDFAAGTIAVIRSDNTTQTIS